VKGNTVLRQIFRIKDLYEEGLVSPSAEALTYLGGNLGHQYHGSFRVVVLAKRVSTNHQKQIAPRLVPLLRSTALLGSGPPWHTHLTARKLNHQDEEATEEKLPDCLFETPSAI
jgi:hypothetical protein